MFLFLTNKNFPPFWVSKGIEQFINVLQLYQYMLEMKQLNVINVV